jgi:hypothetical protein
MVSLAPSPNRAEPPAFHRMCADAFEQICRALLDREDGVHLPELYHTPRQPQFGIDIDGEHTDGSGMVVVSCKCYATIRKRQLAEWSDDFLKFWENYWKERRVRRFILAVAAPVHSQQRRADVAAEKARFAQLGITYEVWAPHQLQEKLRGHPGIVSQYLGPEYVPRLCGSVEHQITQPMLDTAIVGQIATVQAALAVEIDARIEAAEASLRRCDAAAIDKALDTVSNDPARWSALPLDAKARLLRLRATRRLAHDDLTVAVHLADQADRLAGPQGGRRVRALIGFRQEGPAAGLLILGEPTSAGERQLRAALLVAGGRPDEALHQLPAEGTGEDLRLRALALAALGRTVGALEAVRAAEAAAPDWLTVRRAGIMVRYSAVLSPGIAFEPTAWPNPVPRDLVREDDEARRWLTEAASMAAAALNTWGMDTNDRHDFETWRLACLASLRERSPDAEAYARSLLAGGNAHPGAVVWSLARGFEFDRRRTVRALEDLLAAGRGGFDHLIALAVVRLEAGRPDQARRDLERYGECFSAGPAAQHLDRWRHIVAMRVTREASVPESVPWERLRRLIQEAERTGDWGPVAGFASAVQERSTADEGPMLAFGAATALAAAGRWQLVAPFGAFLVERIATAAAVRLAAIAVSETGDHGRALKILDESVAAFPQSELPLELRRLRAHCLDHLGRLPEAMRLTERVASATDELPDILAAARMRIAIGDLTGALPRFRAVAARDDLPPEQALAIADVVRLADQQLAHELLRKAQQTGVPEQLAAVEAMLAFSLGRDAEAGPALTKLGVQASREPGALVRVMGPDEAVEFFRRRREHLERVERAYRDGDAPLHVLVSATGTNLADIYDRAFDRNGPTLFVRHGRHGVPRATALFDREWRWQLDITAVLTAWHLDLLDLLEAEFAPLTIPRSLPAALMEMEEQSRPFQPSRVVTRRAILTAVDQSQVRLARLDPEQISDIARLLDERDGLLVDYEGPRSSQFSPLAGQMVNLRRVIDALATSCALGSGAYRRSAELLGNHAREEPLGRVPGPGQALFFVANTLEVFATAGLLEPLLGAFQVFADERWIEIARVELKAAERGERKAERIARLRQRIAVGVERGIYRVLPSSDTALGHKAENERGWSATERCLSELLTAPDGRNIVWIDDRVCSRFDTAGDRAIVGIVEVLSALRTRRLLDDDGYFDRMQQLRAGHFHFIPITEDEVLHHLRRAPIIEDELVATVGLRVLRRSLAEALLLEDHLQIDPGDLSREDRQDEARLLQQGLFLAKRAILKIWQDDDADDDQRRLRSDWVYENLAVDRSGRAPLNGDESARRRLLTFGLAGLIADSMQLTSERQQAYLDWLDARVLRPRFAADPSLATEAVQSLKELALGALEGEANFQDKRLRTEAQVSIARLLLELPESIRLPLLKDPEVLETLPLQHRPSIRFQNMDWSADEFFTAAERALKHGRAEIPLGRRGPRLILERGDEPGPVLRLSDGARGVLADAALDLLDDDVSKRRTCLERHPDWVDRPGSEARARQAEITGLPSGAQRMLALDEERSASPAFGYAKLEEALNGETRPIPRDLFEPKSVEALIRHLRLPIDAGKAFVDTLSEGARQLVRDLGPHEALERLAALPVEASSLLSDALTNMTVAERREMLVAFAERAASPLRRAHAVALLRRHTTDQEQLRESLERLLADGRQRAEAFVAVLRWAERVFERRGEWRALEQGLRLTLVWAHADRITQLLLEAGAPPDFIVHEIGQWNPRGFVPWLLRDPAEGNDPASPARQQAPALWFHLLGHALGEDAERRLAAEHRAAARAAIAIDCGDGGLWPDGFLVARWAGVDALGSFLANAWPCLARALDDRGLAERLTPEFTARILDQGLAAIADLGSQGGESWAVVIAAQEAGAFSADDPQLVEQLTRVDLNSIISTDERLGLSIAIWAAGVARASRDATLETAIEHAVVTAARAFAERYPSPLRGRRENDPQWPAVACTVEASSILARGAQPDEVADRLADLVPKIVPAWPATAPLWRDALGVTVRELPFDAAAPLWRVLLELRARDES